MEVESWKVIADACDEAGCAVDSVLFRLEEERASNSDVSVQAVNTLLLAADNLLTRARYIAHERGRTL